MWIKAEDLPSASAAAILERWDQTAPELQRMIVLQLNLDKAAPAEREKVLIKAINDLRGWASFNASVERMNHDLISQEIFKTFCAKLDAILPATREGTTP